MCDFLSVVDPASGSFATLLRLSKRLLAVNRSLLSELGQVSNSYQVVGGGSELEDPTHQPQSAVSGLEKTAVNPHAGTIDLPPELAKNRDVATVPLHARAQRILAEARKLPGNAASPYVFTHDGRPLRNWGKVWIAARASAAAELGRPDILKLVFHDTCREAARLYDNLGIRREVALVMFGRKTDSIYRRYRIVPAEDLAEAAKRLSAAAKQMEPRKVIPLRRRRRASAP